MKSLGRKVRMSFYKASDGPRIMLFGPMDVDLVALQRCFRELSEGGKDIRLDREPFVIPFGGVELVAKCLGSSVGIKKLRRQQGLVKKSNDAAHFEWRRSAEGWDEIVELMNGLIRSAVSSHQYLADSTYDDAIIVVSKGEYSDDVIATS
jgi:hypothetical protein